MNIRNTIYTVCLLLCSVTSVYAKDVLIEETDITKKEARIFQSIAKFDNSFHYSKKAKRYYRVHPETKTKLPILTELVFSKSDDLYFGEFISYTVTVKPDTSIVTYTFDAGSSNRGEGTAMVTPNGVIKTERSCGISACIVQVVRNGKILYEGP